MHLKTDTATAQSHFSQVPTISHSRNAFTIAEKHVTTMAFDNLYPMYWKYVYPGDTISVAFKFLARLQTQIGPLYDDLYIDLHAWYTPLRLLQTNWARFQFNAQPGGPSQDNSALTTPNINLTSLGSGGFVAKSLYDYFGLPVGINASGSPGNTQWINNYLGRAYNLIWNDNYRDQNLQNPVQVDLDEGPDLASNYVLLKRGRRHDRFTSALPFQQKGAAVTIPLGSSAPVEIVPGATGGTWMYQGPGATNPGNTGGLSLSAGGVLRDVSGNAIFYDPSLTLQADLTSATAATVNLLRQSVAVQHLLEADARGGTRDVEAIQHRWGVTVPDFRLQRPEYLGGQTLTFDAHIVPQTSETATTPQATLTQFSQAMSSMPVTHSFVEHGVFMILVSARSNLTYQQGLLRELSYKTRFDWYQPEFSNLGEVAVKNKEILFLANSGDENTFGFQEYGYELRYSLNRVTAEMRSGYAQSLDSRHMADDYGNTLPTLGSAWIQSNTPIDRNIVVHTSVADPVQFNFYTQGKIARTLPMYSIPGLNRL